MPSSPRTADNHLFWLGPPAERAPGGESFVDLMDARQPRATQAHPRSRHRRGHAWRHDPRRDRAGDDLDPEQAVRFEADNVSVTLIEHYQHADPAHAWRVVFTNLLPAARRRRVTMAAALA